MKVILNKDIAKLGKKYDVKDVTSGYAQNFLFPRSFAMLATKESMKKLDALKAEEASRIKVQEDLLAKNIHELEGKSIVIKARANELGHLFAGLHKEDLVDHIKSEIHSDIETSFIVLDRPIKEVGEFDVLVSAGGKEAKLKVVVERA